MTPQERDAQIRAAGMTQAVIASGADVEDWPTLIGYGLNLSRYFAGRIMKENVKLPAVPKSLKEKAIG
jgi:hypothetical protein